MTLFCTSSPNDTDLVQCLGSSAVVLPIQHGDVCFHAHSDQRVLIERKKVGDMASCILSNRYLNQCRQASAAGFDYLCLIVEGDCRPSPEDGLLERPVWQNRKPVWVTVTPAIPYFRFNQYLDQLQVYAGVIVKRSRDVLETAAQVRSLYEMFQRPPEEHGSLSGFYNAPDRGKVSFVPPGLVQRVAKELDGVGWERSRAVAREFATVREMVAADEKRWRGIEGIGKKTAAKVVRELNGTKVPEK
ncbi:MAG: hypothetical protein JRN35_05845 [Nitrososphaerota archaeon]|nr:hypothetical protein [Nitrososphaerota archaeon]